MIKHLKEEALNASHAYLREEYQMNEIVIVPTD